MSKEVPEVCLMTAISCVLLTNNIQSLHDKRVLSLDLSAIIAGSGVRGQFEEKFKALLRDIEDEVCNIWPCCLASLAESMDCRAEKLFVSSTKFVRIIFFAV